MIPLWILLLVACSPAIGWGILMIYWMVKGEL